MHKMILALSVISAFNAASAIAGEPLFACRAKTSTLIETAKKFGNAGCIISKENEAGEKVVLMIYTSKDEGGYAFPGGKPASQSNDVKEAAKVPGGTAASFVKLAQEKAAEIGLDKKSEYGEPIACSAARETKEETGLDVLVGDVLIAQKQFLAFKCYSPNVEVLKALDTDEVKDGAFRWISKKDYLEMKDNAKGASKERFVYDNNEILKKIFKGN